MKMEHTVCSETLAYKIQTPKNYPEEGVRHSEHGESLKSRNRNMSKRLLREHINDMHIPPLPTS